MGGDSNRTSILMNKDLLLTRKSMVPARSIRERLDDFVLDLQAGRKEKLPYYYHTDTVTKIYYSEEDGGRVIECFVGRMDFLKKFKHCVAYDPTAKLQTISIDKMGMELGTYQCKWGEGIYMCEWIVEMQDKKPIWTKYRGRIYMPTGFELPPNSQKTLMPKITVRQTAGDMHAAREKHDMPTVMSYFHTDTKTTIRLAQEDAPFGEDSQLLEEYIGVEALKKYAQRDNIINITTMKTLSVDSDHREIGMYESNLGQGIYYTRWIPVVGSWMIYRNTIYMPIGFEIDDDHLEKYQGRKDSTVKLKGGIKSAKISVTKSNNLGSALAKITGNAESLALEDIDEDSQSDDVMDDEEMMIKQRMSQTFPARSTMF